MRRVSFFHGKTEDVHNDLKTPEVNATRDKRVVIQIFWLPFAHEIPNFHHSHLHSILGKFPVRAHQPKNGCIGRNHDHAFSNY